MPVYFLCSFFASIIGAICGIGGGVIIKPVLDFSQLSDASTISFLSGCTVLSMSGYSVGKSLLAGERRVDVGTCTPLALGAVCGGMIGKQLFGFIEMLFGDQNTLGALQASCLAVITAGALAYTIRKSRFTPKNIENVFARVCIGLLLGTTASFLGIGGGPINLIFLYYYLGMDTKTAAASSLYIILFSQAASLALTVFTGTIPAIEWPVLVLMAVGGIGGGIVGRAVNRKINNQAVERLFIAVMVVIILISLYNFFTMI